MRLLINLVRPKFFIPVHGDYRYLQKHARVAMETGAVEHAIVIEDGDVLELDKDDARKKDKVTAGRVLHRFRLVDRCGGRPGHPRPAHSVRGRHCAGRTGHQQAHRQGGAARRKW